MATSQDALIDRSVIDELQQGMGPAAFADIAGTFCDQIDSLIEQFASAAEAGDVATASRLAHELIGLAGTMGAPKLSTIARQAMALCRNQDVQALPDIAGTMRRAAGETLEAFRAYA